MARSKVRAGWMIETVAWAAVASATLAAAYEISALIAHCGTWIHWR